MSGKTELVIDGAKASPVAAFLATVLAGVDWGTLATAAAFFYSAILIGEKLWKLVVQPLWRRFAQGPAS